MRTQLRSRFAGWKQWLLTLALALMMGASALAQNTNPVLIVYDSGAGTTNTALGWIGNLHAKFLANLLGHFNLNYTIEPVESYQAGQMADAPATFYLGTIYGALLPTAFTNDVITTTNPVCWIKYNMWQVSGNTLDTKIGFTFIDLDESGYTNVIYKGISLQKNPLDPELGLVGIINPNIASSPAVAWRTNADNSTESIPYITHGSNFWYVSDSPFDYMGEQDRYLAFCDVLHDILGINAPESHTAIIRLEDVTMEVYDPVTNLTPCVDYLHTNNVPFAVAVIPYYTDPLGVYNNGVPETHRISDAADADSVAMLQALEHATNSGGQILIHGYTHQYDSTINPYTGVSADDFEFWRETLVTNFTTNNLVITTNITTGIFQPLAEDSTAWAYGRINAATNEFTLAGLHWVGWETVHYTASATDYRVFATNFDLTMQRVIYFADDYNPSNNATHLGGQLFPYVINQDVYGQKVMGETCGNYEPSDFENFAQHSVTDIINAAHAALVVRDGWGNAFYHGFYGPTNLATIVTGIKALGYKYVPLVPSGPPVITFGPASQTNLVGTSPQFGVAVIGSLPLKYQWRFNGTPIAGATNDMLTLGNLQLTNAGSYTAVITNSFGSVTSAPATMTVYAPPTITSQPTNLVVVVASNPAFTVAAAGTAPLTYQWYFNSSNLLAGATAPALTVTNAQLTNSGDYSVVVSNSYGMVTSAVASLIVGIPVNITNNPVSQAILQGNPATFTVGAAGTGLIYQWWFNTTNLLTGATNSTFTLPGVLPANAGGYSVVVTNLFGSATSTVATLTVHVPAFITSNPAGQTVAAGGTVSLSATAGGTAPFAYQWIKDGRILTGATNSTLTVTNAGLASSGAYYVVTTNLYGMGISVPATVAVGSPDLLVWGANNAGQLGDGTTDDSSLPINVASNAVAAAAGADYSLFIKGDGTLWAMGTNDSGQLGIGAVTGTNLPGLVASNVVAVAAGNAHSLFVKNDGTLWAMGDNSAGELGNGTTISTNLPFMVTTNVVAIAAGYGHSLFVKNDGTLWAMGNDDYGQLGDGTTSGTGSPVMITNHVVAVAAGAWHSLFLKNDGTAWAMGYNGDGQLGNGTTNDTDLPALVTNNVVAVATGADHSLFVRNDGIMWAMGYNANGQLGNGTTSNTNLPVREPSNVAGVSAGAWHSLFLKNDGTVWAMGDNEFGQLGDGTLLEAFLPVQITGLSVANVISGSLADHTLAVGLPQSPTILQSPTNQTVLSGSNVIFTVAAGGFLPLSYQWYYNSNPLAGGTSATLAINNAQPTNAGSYFAIVTNAYGSVTSSVATLTVHVAAFIATNPASQSVIQGSNATFTVTGGGDAPLTYQWYLNSNPLASATNSTLALTNVQPTDGGNYTVTVSNNFGSAGSLAATLTVDIPPVITNSPASQVVLQGNPATFTVVAGGDAPLAYQWYFNSNLLTGATSATLNVNDAQPTNAGSYFVIVTNAFGSATSTVATLTVHVPPFFPTLPTNQTVAAGGTVTLSTTASGTAPFAYQWLKDGKILSGATNSTLTVTNAGQADSGMYTVVATNLYGLGISVPTAVAVGNPDLLVWGDNNVGQLGDGTTLNTNRPIDVASNVVAAAAGANHSLFVKQDGTLWAMGANDSGQLGLGPVAATNLPVQVAANVTAAAAGNSHSLFVKNDGTLWAAGNDDFGQLGNGTTFGSGFPAQVADHVVAVAAGAYHSLFLKNDGTLWAMGDNAHGQLGNNTTNNATLPFMVTNQVVAIAAGAQHSLFVKADGTLWTMGDNGNGQLGDATTTDVHIPIMVATNAATVSAGAWYSLFVKNDGTVWAMGDNEFGQLGDGTALEALLPVQVTGISLANAISGNLAGHSLAVGRLAAPAILQAPANQVVLAGSNATFTVTAGGFSPLAYQWYFNTSNLLAGATAPTLTITNAQPADAGGYSVVVTNTFGAITSIVATLTVHIPATITNPPAAQSVVLSNTATFTVVAGGDAPLAYQWYFNSSNLITGATAPTLTITNAQPADAGGYSVVVSNPYNFVTSAVAALTVNIPAFITNNPANVITLVTSNVTFTVGAGGDAPLTYQWYFNSNLLAGATSATLAVNDAQPTNAGSYFVIVSNAFGGAASAPATLTVNVPAFITNQPASVVTLVTSNVTFTVGAGGDAPLAYQWYFNSNLLAGATSATLAINNAQPTNAGSYFVTVSNASGGAVSAPATLTVNVPAFITNQPASVVTLVTSNVTFTVGAGGTGPLLYQWYFNATNLLGNATNATLDILNAQVTNAGNYTVVVTNNFGAVTSGIAALTVHVPAFITNPPTAQSVVLSNTATFTVGASGDAPLTYQWYFNVSNLLAGATGSTLTLSNAQVADAGLYSVVVTNDSGAVTSTPVALTVHVPAFITNQPVASSVILGNPASFTVGADGDAPLAYQWSFNGTNQLAGATNATFIITNAQVADAGAYSVIVTNSYGAVTSTAAALTVHVPAFITNPPTAQSVVLSNTATFTVGASGDAPLTYQWYFNASNLLAGATGSTLTLSNAQVSDAGLYSVVITNNSGAVTSTPVALTVHVPAFITNQPAGLVTLVTSNVTFTVGAGGDAPLSYQWIFNATNQITDATNDTFNLTNAQVTDGGAYSVIVTNAYGAVTSSVASLVVGVPVTITNNPASQSILLSNAVTFAVGASGDAPLAYQWWLNGTTPISGATNATFSLTNAQPTDSGAYSVIVTNVYNSATSSVANLTVVNPGLYSYRSAQSGDWSNPATWQQSIDGTNWTAATNTPFYRDASTTIQAGHTVTVTVPVTIDHTVIQAGGEVDVNGTTLTLTGLTPPDGDVAGSLVLLDAPGSAFTVTGAAQLAFENGGTFTSQLHTATAIPAATWATNSTCTIAPTNAGAAAPTGLGQIFGNFIWNWPGQTNTVTFDGTLTNVAGNLEITAGSALGCGPLADTTNTVESLTVGGTIKVHAGTGSFLPGSPGASEAGTYLVLTGGGIIVDTNATLDYGVQSAPVAGAQVIVGFTGNAQYTINGTVANPGSASFDVDTLATLTQNSGMAVSAPMAFIVDGTLICGTNQITGSGSFSLDSGATLEIGAAAGVNGNILAATQSLSTGANYVYNGAAAQVTGTGLPATVNNLTIVSPAAVQLSQGVTVSGTLAVNSGASLDLNSNAVTAGSGPVLAGALTMEVSKTGTNTFAGSKLTLTAGTLTYGGTLTVTAGGSALKTGDSIPVFVSTGGFAGGFTSVAGPAVPAGMTESVSQLTGGTGGSITFGCDGTLAVSVASQSNVTCNGGINGSVTLSATGGNPPYVYSVDGIAAFGTNATVGGLSATSYPTLTVMDANGCTAATSATLTQPAALVASAAADTAICNGGSYALNGSATGGSGAYTFSWSSVPAGFSSGAASPTVSPTNTTTYTVTVTDTNNCAAAASVTVTVHPLPVILTDVTNQAAVAGTTVTWSVAATGTNLTYQWQRAGTNLLEGVDNFTGVTTATLTNTNIGTADIQDSALPPQGYACIVNSGACSVSSGVGSLVIKLPATVTLSNLVQTFDGTAKPVDIATVPPGLAVYVTYDGSTNAPTNPGSYAVSAIITDTNYLGSTTNTLVIDCPNITMNPAGLTNGVLGLAYNQTNPASGGVAPYTYAVTSGSLPAGLSFATNGILAGVPLALGTNTFTITATDTNGCNASQSYTLAIGPSGTVLDTNKPAVTITSPANNATLTNATAVIAGTARDNTGTTNTGVALVLYSFNGGQAQLATTTNQFTNWAATVTLIPGWNTFVARSFDHRGNASAPITNSYYLKVLKPLTIVTNGKGSVSIANGSSLVVTSTNTITATPAAGFVFSHWDNSATGQTYANNPYAFVMQTNLTLTANFVDVQKPTVAITTPTLNQFWSNLTFTARGTANDNGLATNVWYQLNGGTWNIATSTNNWTNWTATLTLTPSNNVLKAYSVDAAGNNSTTSSVSFYYVVSDTLRIQTTGKGTLSPNYSNAVLQIGKSYSVTATATPGFAFTNWVISTNWVGNLVSNKAALTFVMQSNLTLTANFVDITKPTLAITAPTLNQRWTNSAFTVRGTAADNAQVTNVFYQLNGAGWSNALTANNWTNWNVPVSLIPGTNVVQAYAVDATGNHSATGSVSLQFVVTNQLHISATGLGTISPNYSNAWLEIGRSYSMAATPHAGFAFTNWVISTNWVGNLVSNKTTLTFVMQTNLTLQANFIDVQKPVVAITTPTMNQFWSNLTFTVKGTASDNVGVSNVYYQLNGAAWTNAATTNSWTNWTAALTLTPSNNVLKAYSEDAAGNLSPTSSVSFYYVVSDTLRVQSAGQGTLSPNYSNAVLQIGKSYTMTAAAVNGFTFTNWVISTNWVGTLTSNKAALTFVMQSNLTLQANYVDTTKPTLIITAPTLNQRWSNTTFTVRGTAADNAQVTNVWYQLNGTGWTNAASANNWTNWNVLVSLTPGTNLVQAYAVDATGNHSATGSVSLQFVVAQPMTVLTTGSGTVAPNYNGQLLEIGRAYTMTATPGAGYVFSNWTGGLNALTKTISFDMQTNLSLTANFVPNPYTAIQGVYNGLFYDTNGIALPSSGAFTATTTGSGAYSGNLSLAGQTLSFTGQMWVDGSASNTVARPGTNALTLLLQWDLAGQTLVSGTVSDGHWTAELAANRSLFNATTNRAPQAGLYTFVLPGDASSTSQPGGDGYATVTITTAGVVTYNGRLADNTAISGATTLSAEGQWPFYQNLYSGKGSVLGWMNIVEGTVTNLGAGPSNTIVLVTTVTNDIDGTVNWIKLPQAATYYPGGFEYQTNIIGSPYVAPTNGQRVLNFSTGQVWLEGGNLPLSFTNAVGLNLNNTVVNLGTNALSLTLSTAAGTFSGSATDPVSHKAFSFNGVLLQDQNVGSGFFLGTNQVGHIYLEP